MVKRRSGGETGAPSDTPEASAGKNRPAAKGPAGAGSAAVEKVQPAAPVASESDAGMALQGDGLTEGAGTRIEQWFKEWRKPVRQWLSRRAAVPAAELDDLSQEVFVRLLRYSERTVVENPLGYLLRIAGNVASEWRERARIARPHDQEWLDDLQIDPEQEPESSVSRVRMHETVQKALSKLPLRQQQVMLLRMNEGLTYKQIAQRLGLSPRVVLRDLANAFTELRLHLDRLELQ